MSKFKVGDRVAVYDEGSRWVGVIAQVGDTLGSANIRVDDPRGGPAYNQAYAWVHPKQCRRLKPKKKKPTKIEGECSWITIPTADGFFKWALPAHVRRGDHLDNSAFDCLIGKRTRITVEVIDE